METLQLTTDLRMLVYTGVLSLLLPIVYAVGRFSTPGGLKWGAGNRDGEMRFPAWSERAARAHANLTENLAVFAILVLVAHLSGQANDLTALGARIFFWARLAHIIVYTAGITGLRTLVFAAGVTGEMLILIQILS